MKNLIKFFIYIVGKLMGGRGWFVSSGDTYKGYYIFLNFHPDTIYAYSDEEDEVMIYDKTISIKSRKALVFKTDFNSPKSYTCCFVSKELKAEIDKSISA